MPRIYRQSIVLPPGCVQHGLLYATLQGGIHEVPWGKAIDCQPSLKMTLAVDDAGVFCGASWAVRCVAPVGTGVDR